MVLQLWRDSCYSYRQQAAVIFHGSVRETKRAKDRSAPAEDPARAAVCGIANTARTPGRKTRRSRTAARHQKGCAAEFKTAIAAGARTGRLKILPNDRCSRFAVRSAAHRTAATSKRERWTNQCDHFAALRFEIVTLPLRP